MRMRRGIATAVMVMAGGAWAAEEPFDACQVMTQVDAEKALGAPAAGEAANPKVKRPKIVTSCLYTAIKDGKPVEARAQFRFLRNDAEVEKAFETSKLQIATKPLMLRGADAAFWSAKTGQMNVRKGRTWLTVSAGSPKATEREMEPSRRLAEAIVPKM